MTNGGSLKPGVPLPFNQLSKEGRVMNAKSLITAIAAMLFLFVFPNRPATAQHMSGGQQMQQHSMEGVLNNMDHVQKLEKERLEK